jgi:hypothetical protein
MKDAGAVGRELSEANPVHRSLLELQGDAERLLIARSDDAGGRFGGSDWVGLNNEGAREAGRELGGIVEFAERLTHVNTKVAQAELTPTSARSVLAAVEELEMALPFAEREARWLGRLSCSKAADEIRRPSPRGQGGVFDWIRLQRSKTTLQGRTRVLDGAELTDRAWDWMRGAGEFRTGGTYETELPATARRLALLFDRKTPERQSARRLGVKL